MPHPDPGAPRPSSLPRPETPGRGWTADRVEALTLLWVAGDLSASAIARRLGVTRNAVLGKVHRLGLSHRRPPRAAARTARPDRPRRARSARAKRLSAAPAAASANVGRPAEPVADLGPPLVARLEDLSPRACRWPVGDPRADDFAFCGRAALDGPYCPGHARLAYRPGATPIGALLKSLRI